MSQVPNSRAPVPTSRDGRSGTRGGGDSGGGGGSGLIGVTPLLDRHEAAGARMVDFAGWRMPINYPAGVLAEHQAVRGSCGMFDVSHMGCLSVSGPLALAELNRLLTNDLERLADGQVQYTLMCNESGGVVDDMLATRMDEGEILIVPNAANTAAVRERIEAVVPPGSLVDLGPGTAIIAVQGPRSADMLGQLGLPSQHRYMTAVRAQYRGQEVLVSRSGYTGELGFELLVPAEVAGTLWDELLARGVVACGLASRDTLRTEMGYPLHGQDIDEDTTPLEASLGFAIGWDKEWFVGSEVLREQRASGPDRRVRGLRLSGRGVPRPGMPVLREGTVVGATTSGTFSPTLQAGIGLAMLDSAVGLDEEITVSIRGREVPARTVRPPLVDRSPR